MSASKTARARYEMWAISESTPLDAWRKSFGTRDELATESVPRRCRSAKLWFGNLWVIDIRLDSEGRVEEIKPARHLDSD